MNKYLWMLSASVVIGALRDNIKGGRGVGVARGSQGICMSDTTNAGIKVTGEQNHLLTMIL